MMKYELVYQKISHIFLHHLMGEIGFVQDMSWADFAIFLLDSMEDVIYHF
jgi:hypothetical protein